MLAYSTDTVGGVEVQQVILARELATKRHHISMINLDYGQDDGADINGVRVEKPTNRTAVFELVTLGSRGYGIPNPSLNTNASLVKDHSKLCYSYFQKTSHPKESSQNWSRH